MAGNAADQVPPVDGIKVVVELIQTAGVPLMAADGFGFTVTGGVILAHPVGKVKVKVAVP